MLIWACGVAAVSFVPDESSMTKHFSMSVFALMTTCMGAQAQAIFPRADFMATDAGSNAGYGSTVCVGNGLMLTGAIFDSEAAFAAGAVYVIDLATGQERHKLIADDSAALDNFGNAIAFSGNLAVAGAPQHDAAGNNAGAAYVFDLDSGARVAKLLPDIPLAQANFGSSAAMDDQTIVVGAKRDSTNGTNSGRVFLFDVTSQAQTGILSPIDGSVEQRFGSAIAMNEDMIAVSAPGDQHNGLNAGAVYLFDRDGVQIAKIYPDDPQPGHDFGFSLDMDSDTLVVGAPGDETNGTRAGAAYVFDLSTLLQRHKVFPDYAHELMNFGQDIAVHQTTIAVGTSFSGQGLQNTHAYAFDAISGDQIVRLRNPSQTGSSEFGDAIDLNDQRIFVGDAQDDQAASNAGAIFEYGYICEPDLNGDFMLDFFDVSGFLNAFASMDPQADYNQDGQLDFFDVSAFLNAFNAGCP